MALFSIKTIEVGEEITISYTGPPVSQAFTPRSVIKSLMLHYVGGS